VPRSWVVAIFLVGALVGGAVTALLVQPKPGESFPVVFRGTTQGVSSDGDAVAFYPIPHYGEIFPHAFPAFDVAGDNRSDESLAAGCLAAHSAEQHVVFAVVNTGSYQLAWYRCLNKGVVRD
jgi:hypothetical protein